MIEVGVTAEDIENGTPGQPDSCALALALQRHFGVLNVTAYSSYARVGSTRFSHNGNLFVSNFDIDPGHCEPTTIKLWELEDIAGEFDIPLQ